MKIAIKLVATLAFAFAIVSITTLISQSTPQASDQSATSVPTDPSGIVASSHPTLIFEEDICFGDDIGISGLAHNLVVYVKYTDVTDQAAVSDVQSKIDRRYAISVVSEDAMNRLKERYATEIDTRLKAKLGEEYTEMRLAFVAVMRIDASMASTTSPPATSTPAAGASSG